MSKKQASQGFTLIELLVAIGITAFIALVTWSLIDVLIRTRQSADQKADQIHLLQSTFAQWKADLNHMVSMPGVSSWSWDGRMLRISRQSPIDATGLVVVVWRLTGDPSQPGAKVLERWQSQSVHTSAQWLGAWQAALRPSDRTAMTVMDKRQSIPLLALTDWQIWKYTDGEWAQVTGGADAGTRVLEGESEAPDGLRLVLQHHAGNFLSGAVSLDWVSPLASGHDL